MKDAFKKEAIHALNRQLTKSTEGQRITNQKVMKTWKVLKTDIGYKEALARTIDIFHSEPGTPEFEELELLLVLVKDYEDKHILIPQLDPVEVVKLKMEEKGLKAKDLEPIIGSKGHVSSVLSGKREITLKMARALHSFLGIPAEIFFSGAVDSN